MTGANFERVRRAIESAERVQAQTGLIARKGDGLDSIDLSAFPATEDGVALAFEACFANVLRFDHHASKWFLWNGSFWELEETSLAYDWCRTIGRRLIAAHDDVKGAAALAKAAAARGVESLVRAARSFAVTSAVWDTDPLLLGTPDGTVDLSAAKLREARQVDLITQHCAVVPAETPDCPLWDRFLFEATNGDQEMIRFLRSWCGYCLTGDTREHALLFLYGPGGNGKSVFLNTVAGILGSYATNAAMEAFIASGVDRHTTDLAMLRGARLVTASETEEGRPWAEARIKALTGGDVITARFMRQDNFQFRPTFKLMITGNHKPVLHSVDDALRRRFNIVGFEHKPATPDPQLEQKLKHEWPAILRWMIDGAIDWQMNGLVRPGAVTVATEQYFAEQDVMGQWLESMCFVGREREDLGGVLYQSWATFAKSVGEEAGSMKGFSSAMQKRGFAPCRDPKGSRNKRGFRGVELRPMTWADADK
ncbi:phage/plasmid primase, P4 family [Acetobacter sp.]|jgi:putative DNA primase/helicase|uniref:phage/plasmid primase, P4 family n=1 Tax=Acetobacter sp. TaxID=440 RepID=UPI0025C0CADE|nr:phage/plasmid primase, P4 family [Acetobacter sp.]MCH4091084.1 phage/plasmid primase, P4 family [Acetobacter sp.]MCI1300267.1 phage/plasmid primase, P4 family [Acetobacter sp.]MCI1316065.1 phage/plasmid primase, P4 family [Acetobacter sp.]